MYPHKSWNWLPDVGKDPFVLCLYLQVWNLENMLPILALQRHEKAVHAMAVYQDAVYTGSEDMEIKV